MKPNELVIRDAQPQDLDTLVRLVNEGGPDGNPRETVPDRLPSHYLETFRIIAEDSRARLIVAELNGRIVGTFHLVYLTYLAGKGREDAQLEAVHVSRDHRNQGIGAAMMRWAIEEARKRNCRRVQLTTNKARTSAHRFYERLGFEATHEGMKLLL
jgi:GNAT superfamily N-acetyltransferase